MIVSTSGRPAVPPGVFSCRLLSVDSRARGFSPWHTSTCIFQAVEDFEAKLKGSVDLVRCFAFGTDDSNETVDDLRRKKLEAHPGVVVLPPGLDASHLAGQLEIVMHDFAASMLNVLEQRILTVSPSTISLDSYVDSAAFLGSGLSAVVFSTEDDAARTKRKYGRVQKAMGDYALMAGSPLDALDHYNTALELARASSDWVYVAAALEGIITSKMVHEATTRDAFPPLKDSVFQNEGRWRAADEEGGEDDEDGEDGEDGEDRKRAEPGGSRDADHRRHSENSGFDSQHDPIDGQESVVREGNDRDADGLAIASTMASTSMPMVGSLDPFKQPRLWKMLDGSSELLEEVSTLLDECKAAIRKRSALPMLVESELRYARLLVGLKGTAAREKVCRLVGSVQRAAEILPLPEDRLVALIEAADVLGSVGASRKRVLLLWQAVELGKYFGYPEEKTLAVARRALELHDSDTVGGREGSGGQRADQSARILAAFDQSEWAVFRKPLSQETNIPDSWGLVKAGILEATLGLAIYANRHADVWDAASALLRDHSALLSPHRIRSLYDNIKAASLNMSRTDKVRPGRGPPPVVYLIGPKPLEGERNFFVLENTEAAAKGRHKKDGRDTNETASSTPFLYDALASKKKERISTGDAEERRVTQWIRGESGRIDLELYNQSPVTMKIARLVLQAEVDGLPATKAQWRPKVVSLTVPPTSRPVKITLEATPLVEGEFTLTGCRMTSIEGVSWMAPWSERPVDAVQGLNNDLRLLPSSDHNSAKLKSIAPMPIATVSVIASVAGAEKDVGNDEKKEQDDEEQQTTQGLGDGGEADAEERQPQYAGSSAEPEALREKKSVERIRMLRGHRAECLLRFSNESSIPIDGATVRLVRRANGPSEPSQYAIDTQIVGNISDAMPLEPGAAVEIPIAFATDLATLGWDAGISGSRAVQDSRVSNGGALPKVMTFDVYVEYWANNARNRKGIQTIDPPSMPNIGRRAACQVEVSIVPSIEVVDVSVRLAYGPERCLLIAGVVNRSDEPLTAVFCALDGLASRGHVSPGPVPGEELSILPGNRRMLQLELTADILDRGALIRFGRASDALHGIYALPAETVRGGLTPRALSLLQAYDIAASIRLTGSCSLQTKFATMDERGMPIVIDESPAVQDGIEHSCALPVIVAKVGDPLTAVVEFKSSVNMPCAVTYSVYAEPVVLKTIEEDQAIVQSQNERSTVTIFPVAEEGWTMGSALDLGIAWNGVVQHAMIDMPANGTVSQKLSLSCWTPGWFKLEASDVTIHGATGCSKAGGNPGFVSASLSVESASDASARVFPTFLLVVP